MAKVKLQHDGSLMGLLLDNPQSAEVLAHLRHDEDSQMLRKIFDKASGTRTIDRALDWAAKHDIPFAIDRTCVNVGGYYTYGSNLIALPIKYGHDARSAEAWSYNGDYIAGVITHEIRHAWQDYYGLLTTFNRDFAGGFIRLALTEADAYANQYLTERERYIQKYEARKISGTQKHIREIKEGFDDGSELEKGFRDWYEKGMGKTSFYGDAALRYFAKDLGIPGIELPLRNFEYRGWTIPKDGIDIAHIGHVRRLGRDFAGGNYLARISNDELHKRFLNRALAATFFGVATPAQQQQVAEIRKRMLALDLHKKQKLKLQQP